MPNCLARDRLASYIARNVSLFPGAMHKALVDLELIKGNIAQLGQGRMPGAEIIDRETEALQAQPGQNLKRSPRILHQSGFRYLQYHVLRRNAHFFREFSHKIQKIQGCQVIHGHIDGDAQRQLRFLPGLAWAIAPANTA